MGPDAGTCPLGRDAPRSRRLQTSVPGDLRGPGDVGFWQGGFRDREDPLYAAFAEACRERRAVMADVLYSDMHGGQRAVTRFSVLPPGEDRWLSTASVHWILDGKSPR